MNGVHELLPWKQFPNGPERIKTRESAALGKGFCTKSPRDLLRRKISTSTSQKQGQFHVIWTHLFLQACFGSFSRAFTKDQLKESKEHFCLTKYPLNIGMFVRPTKESHGTLINLKISKGKNNVKNSDIMHFFSHSNNSDYCSSILFIKWYNFPFL